MPTAHENTLAIARHILDRLESTSQAAPGTKAELLAAVERDEPDDAASAVEAIFRHLDGPRSGRYRGATPPPASALHRVLDLLPIRDNAREALAARLALPANDVADVAGIVAAQRREAIRNRRPWTADDQAKAEAEARAGATARVAGLVLRDLEREPSAWRPEHRPEPPAAHRHAAAILDEFAAVLRPDVDREALAARWSSAMAGQTADAARQLVRERLAMPHWAAELCLDGQPVDLDDEPGFEPTLRAVASDRPAIASPRYTPM